MARERLGSGANLMFQVQDDAVGYQPAEETEAARKATPLETLIGRLRDTLGAKRTPSLPKGESWRVVEITPQVVVVEGPEGREELPADTVFLMTGYFPEPGLLRQVGVRIDEETLEPEHDPETYETNVPGVFVAGSIVSGRNTGRIFIETGRFHGAAIVKAIVAKG